MELCNSPVIAGRCKRYARHAVGKIDALCLLFVCRLMCNGRRRLILYNILYVRDVWSAR